MAATNIAEAFQLYYEVIRAQHSPEKAERIMNEFRSGFYRYLLPMFGFCRTSEGRKMTQVDVEAAEAYAKQLSVQRLLKAREHLEKGLEQAGATLASRQTYGSRIEQFLQWAEQQHWWFGSRMNRIQNQCCPGREPTGRRHPSNLSLTGRQKQYLKYSMPYQNMSPVLQKEIDAFRQFLTAPKYVGRFSKSVEEATADIYLKEIHLFLGYFYQHKTRPVLQQLLRLETLFPVVTEEELEYLSYKEQKKLWREIQQYLLSWIYEYFEFIQKHNFSKSPRTLCGKLTALKRLGQFLYREQISCYEDFARIPLFITLREEQNQTVEQIQSWQNQKKYVADQSQKWPDTQERETALSAVRRSIVEPLRLSCRPRRKKGDFRKPDVIASSLQYYLQWVLVTDIPPMRQQVYRNLRITLSCPRVRPSDVPPDGYYFPLPPPHERNLGLDGLVADNYLYRTYTHQGKFYAEGVWVLDICSYKTDDTYGRYSILLPNRYFDDGTCLYQYFEQYCCGWWLAEGYKNRVVYSWWEEQYQGQRGRWVCSGRLDHSPIDHCQIPEREHSPLWCWGYLFPAPKTGRQAEPSGFGSAFERKSYQLIGKRISPHTLRYVWATWAFQVRLTEQEVRSLAYAMGHSVGMLREMYERCSQAEKLRPISEAIDRLLFQQLAVPPEGEMTDFLQPEED